MSKRDANSQGEYTPYSPQEWRLHEVVPYLLKYVFNEKPTSNKELRDAFWQLMGKNLSPRRWTTKKRGVPYHIHLLVRGGVGKYKGLKILRVYAKSGQIVEYKQDRYSYVLGDDANEVIDEFISKWGKNLIDTEISKFIHTKKPK
jgi:hypothetical protein